MYTCEILTRAQAAEPVIVSVMSWVAGEESGQQHLVAWLALLLLMAGVLVTFREASVFFLFFLYTCT